MSAPAVLVRRTDPGWEDRIHALVVEGQPFAVACHDDPLPRLRVLAHAVGHGSGTVISEEVRGPLARALRDAHAEGYDWGELGRLLGLNYGNAIRRLAGYRRGQNGDARWYAEHARDLT